VKSFEVEGREDEWDSESHRQKSVKRESRCVDEGRGGEGRERERERARTGVEIRARRSSIFATVAGESQGLLERNILKIGSREEG
jgi:hypothetical protein